MVKLIVCDMDGTFVGKSEELPKDASRYIQQLEKAGIGFTVATGRSDGYMEERIEKMQLKTPYIANNGATIMQGRTALMRKQFPIKGLREIAELAHERGFSIIYTFAGKERVTEITPWIIHEGEKHGHPFTAAPFTEEEWETLKVDKVLVYDETRSGRIEEIEAMCPSVCEASFVRYGDKAVELMEKTANKASGLVELCRILSVSTEDVLAIGDDTNDVELFRLAGASAAVANGKPAAKACAKYICKNEEFEGVKEAVGMFCGVEL